MASSVALIGQTAQTPALINNSMDMTMERIRKIQLTLKTLAAILIAVSFTGCGKPMLYHFKHYHGPFEAVARSNKTYFHSGQTGKIIEKDPCMKYCEPGCFGYEPTCWTRWPEECANCPVQGDVVDSGLPYDGQIIMDAVPDGSMGAPMPSYETHPIPPAANPAPVQLPADPQVVPSADETRLPAVRVPSLPADVESAIPSPSDSTRYQARQTAAPNLAARAAKPKAATPMTAISSTPSTYQVPTGFKAQEQSLAAKTSRIEAPKTSPMLKAQAEPIQTARIALPTKSVTAPEEPAAEVAKVPSTLLAPTKKKVAVKSNRSTKPTSSRRRAETLAEKLRVRPTPVSADSYFAAVESIATESKVVSKPKTPASKQVVAKPEPKAEAQKPQMLKIVQSTDSPKKSKARVSQELSTAIPSPARTEQPAQSTVQFGRLANKLKNAKTPTLSLQHSAKPKVEESNPAAKRNKLSTLRVSDTGSSEIRFAGKSSAKKQRLGTLSTGTELRFSSKTE